MQPHTLYLHSHGQPVRALQMLLRRFEPALTVDGRFGPKTERAVRLAQRRLGLFPADGMAGPQTLDALAKTSKAPKAPTALPQPAPPAQSFGAQLGAMAHQAGANVVTAEREAVDTVEKAVKVVESWIAGLGHAATPIPPALQHAVQPAKAKAQREPMPPGDVADPKSMSLSEAGRKFVFRHEAGDGKVTAHLHHPSADSGVTIGPGYDMRDRKPDDIAQDLQAANVAPDAAASASKGAGLRGPAADKFAADNKSLLNLGVEQQVLLQRRYKGRYENMVRHGVTIPLHQYEFDALVSYAGNPGSRNGWHATINLVNQHRFADAMAEIAKYVYSGGHVRNHGLVNRRVAESKLFLYGDYAA